ncbi:unnamed protein product [Staurois parvus]|uniref:Uncharacterized protein n=1 Tax=Staurois parvus TaxID=386267 RepID=A0ABN9AKU6_9NEOB|nr:unnamed protein product [Staurois parvus]
MRDSGPGSSMHEEASVAMETAAMGGRTGTHERLWTWQQHEEAVYRGLWQIRGLAAAIGGP